MPGFNIRGSIEKSQSMDFYRRFRELNFFQPQERVMAGRSRKPEEFSPIFGVGRGGFPLGGGRGHCYGGANGRRRGNRW